MPGLAGLRAPFCPNAWLSHPYPRLMLGSSHTSFLSCQCPAQSRAKLRPSRGREGLSLACPLPQESTGSSKRRHRPLPLVMRPTHPHPF